MKIDAALQNRLTNAFKPLERQGAHGAFPPPSTLSEALERALPSSTTGNVLVEHKILTFFATFFATAAVDAWLRSVHSFLISASVTNCSPIWAAVSGYYSSHYSVRGLAHLLGYFQLYGKKRIVQIQVLKGKYYCSYDRKSGSDREHQLYWKIVHSDPHFSSNPLFTTNNSGQDTSDVAHRDRANYADHLARYPNFNVPNETVLRERITRISKIVFSAPPIPRRSKFPDLDSVQVVAYHRLVAFRTFLDEVLSGTHRFWKIHRTPSWAANFTDFQLTTQDGLGSIQTTS
jgi:hypothetical protein